MSEDPLVNEMFAKLSLYMSGEIKASAEDYSLLEKLNLLAAEKYKVMADKAAVLVASIDTVNSQYESFKPYLEQIDLLDQNITKLETIISQLDAYTKRLEAQFARVYKQ